MVETFPYILLLGKIILGAVAAFAVITIIIATVEYKLYPDDKKKRAEMKDHIVTSLTVILVILIAYFILSALGPLFRFMFV